MSASSGNSNSAALAKGQKRPSSAAPSIGGLLQGISEHSAITPNTVKSSGRGSDYFSADHKNDPIYSSQKEGEPRQAKIPKLSHRTPTASPPRRDDNKILHSIDFITRMPSPVADRVSLPPLKSRCSPESMSDPGSSPSMNQSCTDIIVAGCTAAFDSIPSPAHYGRDNDREFKYSIQHSSTMAKTTPPLSRDYQFPQPTAHTHTTTISNVLSLSNRLPPYQSTTAAPQHQFRPTATNTITSAAIPTSLASISTSTQTSTSSPTPSSLATIESQLHRLRQYSDELLALSLHDSHRILQQEIRHVEETLLLAKRERSERLIKAFETEFPGLVEVREGVKREGAKLGYF